MPLKKLFYILGYGILILLFSISISIGQYYPLANIWVFTGGIIVLSGVMTLPMNDLLHKIIKIKTAIRSKRLQLTDDDFNHLYSSLAINDKALLDQNHICSTADIERYLKQVNPSTIMIKFGSLTAGSILCLVTGSIMNTLAMTTQASTDSNAPSSTQTPYNGFPPAVLSSIGYTVMNISHLVFLFTLSKHKKSTKRLNQILSEETRPSMTGP